MNLTFFIGNGFDINMGLETSYPNFYKYFLSKFSDIYGESQEHPELVKIFQTNEKTEYWADLELLLGKSIMEFPTVDRLLEEKVFLEEELNQYLFLEQERMHIANSYELRARMDDTILGMIQSLGWSVKDNEVIVNFITFNYTNTVEKIISSIAGFDDSPSRISAPFPIFYNNTYYVHGTVNDAIVLGVDSESQCKYDREIDHRKLRRIMEKPEQNTRLRADTVSQIIEIVRKTDKIIIYGSSIGYTDNTWWELIAEWLLIQNKDAESDHQLGVFSYFKGGNSVSATAQTQFADVEDRFEDIINNLSKKEGINVDYYRFMKNDFRKNIRVKRCEDWMFSFNGAEDRPAAIFVHDSYENEQSESV